MFPWHQYLLAVIFILGGVNHFRKPKIYERIIPPFLPAHNSLVLISGILEMLFGFMLITEENQSFGAWGLIILLVLFIPIHIYMLQDEKASLKLPKWALIVRLPLQAALIYWVLLYI